MSSLILRGAVYYYQYYRHGRKHLKSTKTRDRTQARRLQKVWDGRMAEVKSGLAPAKVAFSEACRLFLARKQATLRPSSIVRYRELIAALRKGLAVEWVHQLNEECLADYSKLRAREGAAPKTVADELTLLNGVLKLLFQERLIRKNPVRRWPALKTPVARPERTGCYSQEEVARLKDYFRDHEFGPAFFFSLYTGCRRGELGDVRIRDVSQREGVVRLRNIKTESNSANAYRTIALHQELMPLIRCRLGGNPDAPLFPEIVAHSRNWPHTEMRRACTRLNIQYRRFHGLRHTVATYLLAAGVPLRDLMEIMGWTQLDTAQRYLHLAKAASGAINKLTY